MSKYHRKAKDWVNLRHGQRTVISKIGETTVKKGEYTYQFDDLKVRCDCGNESEISSKHFFKSKRCRTCGNSDGKLIGKTINKQKVIDVKLSEYNNNTIKKHLTVECQLCFSTRELVYSSFMSRECYCKCQKNKHRPITPQRYITKLKTGALKRGISYDDSVDVNFITSLLSQQDNRCKYSSIPISFEEGTCSVDRIDSSIGYSKDNIQLVHKTVNIMKNNLSHQEFLDLCSKIYQNSCFIAAS